MRTVFLRYRRVLGVAILGGGLSSYVAVVYAVIVLGAGSIFGVGTHNGWLTIAATTLIAVTFDKARERVRRAANRALYGERATPLEVVAHLSAGVAEAAGSDGLTNMARLIADGTGGRATVWLRSPDGYERAAAHPPAQNDESRPEGDLVVDVAYQGEILGALAVQKNPGDPVTPTEERLLRDIASQAGLALRNFSLTRELMASVREIGIRSGELRASRRRVVAAQDSARRKLERDIHDGAQQHLVALSVKLRLAQTLISRKPETATEHLKEIEDVTEEALGALRDVSSGIYPPILAGAGLIAALEAQTKRSPIPVTLEYDDSRRYSPAAEAAAYFTSLEAIQNALKYSAGSRITVRLVHQHDALAFAVSDDGRGFDPATATGTGLQMLQDRVAAFGGTVSVTSAQGTGTTVSGRIPAPALIQG